MEQIVIKKRKAPVVIKLEKLSPPPIRALGKKKRVKQSTPEPSFQIKAIKKEKRPIKQEENETATLPKRDFSFRIQATKRQKIAPVRIDVPEHSDTSENSDSAVEAERRQLKTQREREKKNLEKRKEKKKEKTDEAPVAHVLSEEIASEHSRYSAEQIESMLKSESLAAPIEGSISHKELLEIESSIGPVFLAGANDPFEDCDTNEKVFFRTSFADEQERNPPLSAKQRVQKVTRNPYEFAYIFDVMRRAPKDIQSTNALEARQAYRNVVYLNTRAHEEAYMCEAKGMEKRCCNGGECAGLLVNTASPFILKAFLFPKEHENYEQHTTLPREVEEDQRSCILCMRNFVTTRLAFLRAYGSEESRWNSSLCISKYRNLVDQPGEYRLEDCNASTSKNGEVQMDPVVRFSRSDYDHHMMNGRSYYKQKLEYPDMDASSGATVNENTLFNNTRKVGVR